MVYYQSTPLISKTEQTSQAQFCTPLPISQQNNATVAAVAASAISQHQLQQLHQQQQQQPIQLNTSQNLYNGSAVMPQLQQQQQQQPHQHQTIPTATSISNNQIAGHAASNQHMLNIKKELLVENRTVYTTGTASATTNAPTTTTTSKGSLAASTATLGGRKSNAANKPQFKCEQCGMTFGSKSAHTSHTKSHAKNGEYTSTAGSIVAGIEVNEAGVPIGIPKQPLLKPNPNGTPGSDPYQCNVCQKTFAVPARLIRHYRTHTGERPFECEFCHKLFSVKENLQVHRRIHTKERPYKCDVCGRAFEHSGKLHRHMRIHTGERPHKCSVCEKTFIQSGQLVIHMRTHTGEKPYKCPVEGCGKGFTCSKQLKVHSRTHTGEKPYHCDICYRDFGYNHVLKLHRVQHYGSKCYKCTICDETFKSKKEMEAHIKGHANEIPDDEEGATSNSGGARQSNSSESPSVSGSASVSSGGTNSAPASPQSPLASVTITKVRKPRQERKRVTASTPSVTLIHSSPSPGSPSLILSSNSSMAASTRFSNVSPTPTLSSPALSIKLETDFVSLDSGIVSNNGGNISQTQAIAGNGAALAHRMDDLPTDLSMQQNNQLQSQVQPPKYYMQQCQQLPKATPVYYSPPPQQQSTYTYLQTSAASQPLNVESAPTINPALLEAASIAQGEDVTNAALQIMELSRSQQQNQHQLRRYQQIYNPISPQAEASATMNCSLVGSQAVHYDDDTNEANELIEHYKRGELARHGLHRGYAPVPKFETSLLNNEIVRQVEAALAPLRSSTDSPDRSSSPESDSMMMADRDVMTLPLRKRKLYMNEAPSHSNANTESNGINNRENSNDTAVVEEDASKTNKVMRMSSVIQFAKAS